MISDTGIGIPLNTKAKAGADIQNPVSIRNISGGTRSKDSRRCRDTFLLLKKTCQKNAISIWALPR